MLVLSGVWSNTDTTKALIGCIRANLGGLSQKQVIAVCGPDAARSWCLPDSIWMRLILLRGYRLGQSVIQDAVVGRPVDSIHALEASDNIRCRMVKADTYFRED